MIKKILVHLKLWDFGNKDPPKQKFTVMQLAHLDYEPISDCDYVEYDKFPDYSIGDYIP